MQVSHKSMKHKCEYENVQREEKPEINQLEVCRFG